MRDSHARGTSGEPISPPSGVSNARSAVVKECLDWIDKFKSGVTKKSEAMFEILAILASSEESASSIKAAAESYIEILDQHEVKVARASKRGRMLQENEKSPNSASSSQNSSRPSTRPQSRSSSTCSDAAIRKKKKVDEPDLPWVTRNKLLGVELRPELRATLELLRAWSVNPKQVKASIVNTPGCPAFPDSEWLNLIQGKTVNLDNVFSGFYSTSTDNQRTESVGEIELKFGAKDASKPVTTHGDWAIAFDLARDAYLFAFAHRAEELKLYQWYILQHFATKHESEHSRVIALDRAIRK